MLSLYHKIIAWYRLGGNSRGHEYLHIHFLIYLYALPFYYQHISKRYCNHSSKYILQTISEANGKLPLSFLALSPPYAANAWLVRWICMIFPQPTNFKMSAFVTDFLSSVGKFQLLQGFKIYINKFSYSYISSLLLLYKQN